MAVFRASDGQYEDVSAQVKSGTQLPAGRYVVASLLRARPGPWYGGKTYVDLMYPGVTEKFLAVTMDAYKREIGSEFGKRVPGVFTDEPNLTPAGGLPWTDRLPELFQQKWGYSLSANLPALIMLLFWKRTTAKGIAAAVMMGMMSSLAWILLSAQCFRDVYGIDPKLSPVPFSQPALVTVPWRVRLECSLSTLTVSPTVGLVNQPTQAFASTRNAGAPSGCTRCNARRTPG